MRIAFVVHSFPVFSEPFIATSALALAERGHTVDILGLSNTPPSRARTASVRIDDARVTVRNIVYPARSWSRAAALPRVLIDNLTRNGLKTSTLARPLTYRSAYCNLSAFFEERFLGTDAHYDIIHCQFATLAWQVLKHRAAGLMSGSVIVHFRGYDISQVIQQHGEKYYDGIFRDADYFVANCEYFRNRAIQLGCLPERICAVGTGIRLTDFPYRPPHGVANGPIRFIAVGRLIERKGIHRALQALARLHGRGFDFTFDVIGDGEERDALAALSAELGLADRVHFHGARPHAELRSMLENAHVMLAPSMRARDGGVDAPVNTIKEAMATGVPVVATDHGGIPELVIDGDTGILVREDDEIALGNGILRMLELEETWPTMTQRAHQHVCQTFGIDVVTDQMLQAYEAARNMGGAPSGEPAARKQALSRSTDRANSIGDGYST